MILNTFFVALSFLVVRLHSLTLFALTFLCVSHCNLLIFVLFQTCHTFVNSSILLPFSGFQFLFFMGECSTNLWTSPIFSDLANMTREDLTTPVAAAATSQVKLCPYDEEEPHLWYCLIETQFAAAGIKSQKLKYANVLASLPKQVLRDILDTLDVCNDSDDPFDFLTNTLLGQFGKSKWQSYFQLLRLPMEVQGLKQCSHGKAQTTCPSGNIT